MPQEYPYVYQICVDMEQIGEPPRYSLEGFKPLVIITEVLGAVLLILTIIWACHYRGGFAWRSNPSLEFNWHPLLMITGLVFLYANAMLIYRTQRNVRKRRLKLMHGGIMLLIIVLTTIALVAVFDSHNLNTPTPIPNLYSLHSWIGLTSVVLFCCQWLAGCVSFLYPGIQGTLRASYLPIHVYFGIAGFISAVASCLLGLNEKAIFTLNGSYSMFVGEGILINMIGLLLILFAGLSVYLVSQERYKRLPRPEDESLLTGSSSQ